MSNEPRTSGSAGPAYRTERIIASLVMAWVIVLTSYMVFQDHALSEASMYFLKILLALSGAVMLATLPGFFDINYSIGGLTIRAAGGAAAFVFIYTQSPQLPALKSTVSPQPAGIVRERPGPTSHNHTTRPAGAPVVVTLSLDPSAAMSSAAVSREDGGALQQPGVPTASAAPALGAGGAAYAGLSTVAATVRTAAVSLAENLWHWLQRAALAVRRAVSELAARAAAALEALRAALAADGPVRNIFAVSSLSELDDNLNTLLGPAVASVEQTSIELQASLPILYGLGRTLGETTGNVVTTLDNAVTSTTKTVGDLASGLLQQPGDAVAHTGKAVRELTENAVDTTRSVLSNTEELTRAAGEQVSAVTDALNRITPELVAKIDPQSAGDQTQLGKAASTLDGVTAALNRMTPGLVSKIDPHFAGENTARREPWAVLDGVTAALPPLPELAHPAVKLPPLSGLSTSFADGGGQSEILSGCGNCLLQPLDTSDLFEPDGLGRTLGSLGIGAGANGLAGGAAAAGGVAAGGPGSAGGQGSAGAGPVGGAVSSVAGGVGSTVRGVTGKVLGKR
jgi:ElaB/YqjD/DUF883 family membrane-anchored ribosome-binding protein